MGYKSKFSNQGLAQMLEVIGDWYDNDGIGYNNYIVEDQKVKFVQWYVKYIKFVILNLQDGIHKGRKYVSVQSN